MIDINILREEPQKVQEAAQAKNIELDIERILELDKQVKRLRQEAEEFSAQKNAGSKRIQQATDNERAAIIEEMRTVDESAQKVKDQLTPLEEELQALLYKVPNIPLPNVPRGKDESENVAVRSWGTPKEFDFEVKDHLELGEALDIIDTKRGAKVAGARFAYLKGAAAQLEYALVQFTMNILTDEEQLKPIAESVAPGYSSKPFTFIVPPHMIRPDVYRKMARLSPEDIDERYHLSKDDLYLIGSAEHTLGPIHMDETLEEKDLPIRYLGFSPAYRREAGSYGKDTRGIIRVHQFDKLEMESFATPETSELEQNFFVAIQEHLFQQLELPYQVVEICTGDMGKPDARQIDIETWIPSQNTYRETHTSDLMTDYQARRLNTRIKREDGTRVFAHMNDATAIAISRALVAIIENYQQEDGSVAIPSVLQPYMGGKTVFSKD